MLERLDILVKWFLRIIAGIYLLFLALTILITPFTGGLEHTFSNLFTWIFIMPFDAGVRLYEAYEGLPEFFTYVFWIFWFVTGTRWVITGKHFWQ